MAEQDSAQPAVRVERATDAATLLIDEKVYCREAVLKALHWYTDRYFLSFSPLTGERISIRIRPKNDKSHLETILSEFENSLLDAQLRVEIARETARLRELIVAKAFAEGDLLEDSPVGDWKDPVASQKVAKRDENSG